MGPGIGSARAPMLGLMALGQAILRMRPPPPRASGLRQPVPFAGQAVLPGHGCRTVQHGSTRRGLVPIPNTAMIKEFLLLLLLLLTRLVKSQITSSITTTTERSSCLFRSFFACVIDSSPSLLQTLRRVWCLLFNFFNVEKNVEKS